MLLSSYIFIIVIWQNTLADFQPSITDIIPTLTQCLSFSHLVGFYLLMFCNGFESLFMRDMVSIFLFLNFVRILYLGHGGFMNDLCSVFPLFPEKKMYKLGIR